MVRLHRPAACALFVCVVLPAMVSAGSVEAQSPPPVATDVAGLSAAAADSLGAAAQAEERYLRALTYDRHAAKLDPSRVGPLQRVGINLISTREVSEAIDWLGRARALDTTAVTPLYWMGIAYWTLGDYAAAEGLLARVAAMRPRAPTRFAEGRDSQQYPYDLAAVAAIRGDIRGTCEWLRLVAHGGWGKPALARRDPLFAAVRGDPCFDRIMSDIERHLNAERARAARPPE